MTSTEKIVKKLKKEIIDATIISGEGHIPSAFSILDILWVLYDKILNITPLNFDNIDRNHFILSKGHGSLGLYAVLSEKGFFNGIELNSFTKFDSFLGGHPDRNKVPGVEVSTGSLGHGLPMAIGMALGLRIRKIDKRVYVIVGDGECNEGSIWESALLASHHKLNNITCIIDYNHSTDRALLLGDLTKKFASFGWKTIRINGHNHKEIFDSLNIRNKNKPIAIIAETIKGKGVAVMENNPAWHHRGPTKEEAIKMLEELNEKAI